MSDETFKDWLQVEGWTGTVRMRIKDQIVDNGRQTTVSIDESYEAKAYLKGGLIKGSQDHFKWEGRVTEVTGGVNDEIKGPDFSALADLLVILSGDPNAKIPTHPFRVTMTGDTCTKKGTLIEMNVRADEGTYWIMPPWLGFGVDTCTPDPETGLSVSGQATVYLDKPDTFEAEKVKPMAAVGAVSGSCEGFVERSHLNILKAKATLEWELAPIMQTPDCRMVFDTDAPYNIFADYDHWLPVPRPQDNPDNLYGMPAMLFIKVAIKPADEARPTPDRIELTLEDVSRHRGRCCNHPHDVAEKDDLCFAEQKYQSGIIVDSGTLAHTKNRVLEAVVAIQATDCGAWGKLVAKAKTLDITATFEPAGKPYLCIPRDDHESHIADAWAKEKGVEGYPSDWDEVEISGQAIKGDGLTLYQKYRGFVVLEGDRLAYRRLEPRMKHLFAIDPANLLNVDLWEGASDIKALKLTEDLVMGGGYGNDTRIVDFNEEGPGGSHKYAVRIQRIDSDDMLRSLYPNMPDDFMAWSPSTHGYCYPAGCTSPKDASIICIFPQRIRDSYCSYYKALRSATIYLSPDYEAKILASGVSIDEAKSVVNSIESAMSSADSLERCIMKYVELVALHEIGHACGVTGHVLPFDTDEETGLYKKFETGAGDVHCPMRYTEVESQHFWMLIVDYSLGVFGPSTGTMRFCASGFNCFKKLNVNDRI